ncbi:head-tail adaptor protein [Bacillus sp. T33-2]|nr:head-tail adaptor protein [Bacillus sp. T33-2]
MNLADFRHRITIQKLEEGSTNENGFPVDDSSNWKDVMTVWAATETLGDKTSNYEFYEAATTMAKNTLTFIIRYKPDLNSDMRIVFKERDFEIVSMINENEENRLLLIVGREVV